MDKQEKRKRIENLDDLKKIRFNTGKLLFLTLISLMFKLVIISAGFSYLFFVLDNIILGLFFFGLQSLFLLLEIFLINRQDKLEEEFLLKIPISI